MSTEPEPEVGTESYSVSGRFLSNRDLYLFLPFLLGFSDQEPSEGDERIVLVNPFTQGMIVLDGSSRSSPLLRDLLESREESHHHPPASKASIDAMPVVEIQGEGECVICLEEFKAEKTVVVKEMPCKHRFHGECIEKWLGFHGSCPVCRYEMPGDGDEVGKKGNDGRETEIWVRFSVGNGRGVRDSSGDEDGEGNANGSGATTHVAESGN